MIEASARVTAVRGDRARVAIERQSACGGCAAKGGCGTRLIADWFPKRQLSFDLDNVIGAAPGDRVTVGLDERRLQHFALLMYAIPLLGLLGGALFGHQLTSSLGWPAEPGSILGGLSGVATALYWVWQRSRRIRTDDSGVRLLGSGHTESHLRLSPRAAASCDAFRGRG